MGPVTLDEKTLSFGLRRLSDLDSKYQGPDRDQIYFLVNWPEFLFPEARLEILSRDGKVVWSRALPKADLELWQSQIQSTVKANPMSPLRAVGWAIPAQNERLPFEGLADEFRFCLSHLGENTQDRLCSQRYLIRKVGRQLLLGRLRDLGKARILVNGEAAALKGAQAVSNEFPTRFFAELATGETYDFSARPSKVSWADLVRLAEPALGRATGFGTPPESSGPFG